MQELAYLERLAAIAACRPTGDGLECDDAEGETILAFIRKVPPTVDAALQDTRWVLARLRGRGILEGSRITLSLAQDGFDGFAGCNRYGGEYAAADEGFLTTARTWHTERECSTPALQDQEQAYIEALASAVAYRVLTDGLEIDGAAGETVLVFTRENSH